MMSTIAQAWCYLLSFPCRSTLISLFNQVETHINLREKTSQLQRKQILPVEILPCVTHSIINEAERGEEEAGTRKER